MRILVLAALGTLVLGCGQQTAGGTARLASIEDSVSYIIGYKMGENFREQSVKVDPALCATGIAAAMAGTPARMSDSLMQSVMMAFQTKLAGVQRQKDSVASISNREEGEKFLNDNKSKDGVKVTPSGLQYQVLSEGSGPRPSRTSVVTVQYTGTLLDGKKFDSSYDRGQPATFPLDRVIPGWTEGLQLMNAGSKFRFWIPSDLGYGPQGSPPTIPPNATLVFEVELLSFK
jgi:FKBP-type peptidyl-prolyl cis-trans isomerase